MSVVARRAKTGILNDQRASFASRARRETANNEQIIHNLQKEGIKDEVINSKSIWLEVNV